MKSFFNYIVPLFYLSGCQEEDESEELASKINVEGCMDPLACNYNSKASINSNCVFIKENECNCEGESPKFGFDCENNKLSCDDCDICFIFKDSKIFVNSKKDLFALQIDWNIENIIYELTYETNSNIQIYYGPKGISIFSVNEIPINDKLINKEIEILKKENFSLSDIKLCKAFDKMGNKMSVSYKEN